MLNLKGRALFTLVAAFSLLLALSAGALADGDSDLAKAKMLFKKAELHFKLGEFAKALPIYKEAYRVKAIPAFLFNLGQCHRYLGQCDQSNFFFRQYLTAKPESPHKAKVLQLMESCRPTAATAAAKPAAPTVPAKPAEPAVKPKPVKAAESVKAVKPVKAAKPAVAQKPAEAQKTAKPLTAKEAAKPKEDGAEPGQKHNKIRKILFWSGVGLTAALLATGAITGGLAYDKSQTFKDPATPYGDLEGLESSGEALRGAAVATLALGGAMAVGTALIYFLYPEEKGTPNLALSPLPSGGAFTLRGRF